MRRGIVVIFASIFLFAGCAGSGDTNNPESGQSVHENTAVSEDVVEQSSGYQQISQEEVMQMMEEEDNYLILDVRTESEYVGKHSYMSTI